MKFKFKIHAIVCKLAQIPPGIWMTLPLEAKKWLLNERKRQQQEDDKMKKLFALSKSTAVPNDKENNNSNMPNQYARVKNVAKGEERGGCNQGEYRSDLCF
jgi:hypothetical protein